MARTVRHARPSARCRYCYQADNQPLSANRYDYENNTLRLRFPNTPDGVTVEVRRRTSR